MRQAMAKKTLNIVESAYRAVMEEQDDTILWLLAAMQGAGGAHTVVLRGNAVNYAVAGQGAPGLTVGQWKQTQAPKMDRDVVDLVANRRIPVFVIEEDLAERGIERRDLVAGVEFLSRRALPVLFAEYEVVSHW
jgi:sulfur relay (sulfurtransferase) DsrF/TusC family protein